MLFTIHILVKKIKKEFILFTLTHKNKIIIAQLKFNSKKIIKDRKLKVFKSLKNLTSQCCDIKNFMRRYH